MSRFSRRTCLKAASCATALSFLSAARAADSENPRLLIVYFSWSGSSKTVAEEAHRIAGGDIVRLETVEPYPDSYDATVERSKREREANARPALKTALPDLGPCACDLERAHADAGSHLSRRGRSFGLTRRPRDDPRRERSRQKSRRTRRARTQGRTARAPRRLRLAQRAGFGKRGRVVETHRTCPIRPSRNRCDKKSRLPVEKRPMEVERRLNPRRDFPIWDGSTDPWDRSSCPGTPRRSPSGSLDTQSSPSSSPRRPSSPEQSDRVCT